MEQIPTVLCGRHQVIHVDIIVPKVLSHYFGTPVAAKSSHALVRVPLCLDFNSTDLISHSRIKPRPLWHKRDRQFALEQTFVCRPFGLKSEHGL